MSGQALLMLKYQIKSTKTLSHAPNTTGTWYRVNWAHWIPLEPTESQLVRETAKHTVYCRTNIIIIDWFNSTFTFQLHKNKAFIKSWIANNSLFFLQKGGIIIIMYILLNVLKLHRDFLWPYSMYIFNKNKLHNNDKSPSAIFGFVYIQPQ